jgi:hypothetical protein
MAAQGKIWSNSKLKLLNPSISDRMHLALCNLAIVNNRTLPLSFSNVLFQNFM